MFKFSDQLNKGLLAFYRSATTAASHESNDQQVILSEGPLLDEVKKELKEADLYYMVEPNQWRLPVTELAIYGDGTAVPWHKPVRKNRFLPSALGGPTITVWTHDVYDRLFEKHIYAQDVVELVDLLLLRKLSEQQIKDVTKQVKHLLAVMDTRKAIFANDPILAKHFADLEAQGARQLEQLKDELIIVNMFDKSK